MQRQILREEETTTPRAQNQQTARQYSRKVRYGLENETETLSETQTQSKSSPARDIATWIGGVIGGTVGAALMTTLCTIQNPLRMIGQQDAFLLYALLGAIPGFCAVAGRRKVAWASGGMAAAVLLSPPLLQILAAFFGEQVRGAAMSPLVVCAALPIGAFVFLMKWKPQKAVAIAAAAYFLIDFVYNVLASGGRVYPPALYQAVMISTLHGALVGGVLSVLRELGEKLFPAKK
jgi:hypothetical protein